MPNLDFFVYRVHKDGGVDVMSEYLRNKNVVVCEIIKKSHESSKFNTFKVAVVLNDEHVPLIGWPFGGCAIVYKTTLNGFINEVKFCNQRLCWVLLAINSGCTTVILNAYMPIDNYRHEEIWLSLEV